MTSNDATESAKWHELKTWPKAFNSSLSGAKMFEFRVDDRNFEVGDFVLLREWSPQIEEYTGRVVSRRITYILKGRQFGLPENMIIMQLAKA